MRHYGCDHRSSSHNFKQSSKERLQRPGPEEAAWRRRILPVTVSTFHKRSIIKGPRTPLHSARIEVPIYAKSGRCRDFCTLRSLSLLHLRYKTPAPITYQTVLHSLKTMDAFTHQAQIPVTGPVWYRLYSDKVEDGQPRMETTLLVSTILG